MNDQSKEGDTVADRAQNEMDVASLRHEVEQQHAGAAHAASLAWPAGPAPDAVTEALVRLQTTREELQFAVEGRDTERLQEISAEATEAAAAIHGAADLVSS